MFIKYQAHPITDSRIAWLHWNSTFIFLIGYVVGWMRDNSYRCKFALCNSWYLVPCSNSSIIPNPILLIVLYLRRNRYITYSSWNESLIPSFSSPFHFFFNYVLHIRVAKLFHSIIIFPKLKFQLEEDMNAISNLQREIEINPMCI